MLETVPRVVGSRVAWFVVDGAGRVVTRSPGDPQVSFVARDGEVEALVPEGLSCVRGARDARGHRTFLVHAADAGTSDLLAALLALTQQNERLELDLEAMYPSSLALLEEVSMVNEIMPLLPAGTTEREVAEMGLKALVVAGSVERAFYVQVDADRACADVLVHVAIDESGRHASAVPPEGETLQVLDAGCLVARALAGRGDAIIDQVPASGRLGRPGSPESWARTEAVAVPVRYGDSEQSTTLGVLVLVDRRRSTYSSRESDGATDTRPRFGSEQTKLASALASMLGAVLGSRKVAELGKELEMAQTIQRQILPDASARVPGLDVAGWCTTSGAVGGDYFDYLPMADGRTLVVVADVSGHDLASGMLMVSARAMLKVLASEHGNLVDVFDDLGAFLYPDLNRTERFITAVGAALRPRHRNVEIVSAGHNATLVFRRASGRVESVPTGSTILGFLPAPRHESRHLVLDPGDTMLLYTDGVTEAVDARGELFGEERLAAVFAAAAGAPAQEVLASILAAVEGFRDRTAHRDDVTAVVVRAES